MSVMFLAKSGRGRCAGMSGGPVGWAWPPRGAMKAGGDTAAPGDALELVHAPDFCVGVSIAVAGIVNVVRAAIGVDVGRQEEVGGCDEAALLLLVERAIGLIDDLPALQQQRLGNRAGLVL